MKVDECLLVDIYLTCSSTADQQLLSDNILSETDAWLSRYHDCSMVVAGDFNFSFNLNCIESVASSVCVLVDYSSLIRCDELFPSKKCPTC